ncbi:MAG: hypothetical protein H0V46_02365 [Sphingomonas sp.]|nr:hypothetical protein [Sphingomonas sp.]
MKQLLLAGGLALASCTPAVPAYGPVPREPSGDRIQAACPNVVSSDWAAWVNAMPGPNARPTLIVTGKVTVPTGGYRFAWRDMRVMESYPVQVAVDLQVIPPAGMATQAIVTHDVRGQWPISPPVGSVTISCGGRVLSRIAPVETAQ